MTVDAEVACAAARRGGLEEILEDDFMRMDMFEDALDERGVLRTRRTRRRVRDCSCCFWIF
jgi:hypothetical protein